MTDQNFKIESNNANSVDAEPRPERREVLERLNQTFAEYGIPDFTEKVREHFPNLQDQIANFKNQNPESKVAVEAVPVLKPDIRTLVALIAARYRGDKYVVLGFGADTPDERQQNKLFITYPDGKNVIDGRGVTAKKVNQSKSIQDIMVDAKDKIVEMLGFVFKNEQLAPEELESGSVSLSRLHEMYAGQVFGDLVPAFADISAFFKTCMVDVCTNFIYNKDEYPTLVQDADNIYVYVDKNIVPKDSVFYKKDAKTIKLNLSEVKQLVELINMEQDLDIENILQKLIVRPEASTYYKTIPIYSGLLSALGLDYLLESFIPDSEDIFGPMYYEGRENLGEDGITEHDQIFFAEPDPNSSKDESQKLSKRVKYQGVEVEVPMSYAFIPKNFRTPEYIRELIVYVDEELRYMEFDEHSTYEEITAAIYVVLGKKFFTNN